MEHPVETFENLVTNQGAKIYISRRSKYISIFISILFFILCTGPLSNSNTKSFGFDDENNLIQPYSLHYDSIIWNILFAYTSYSILYRTGLKKYINNDFVISSPDIIDGYTYIRYFMISYNIFAIIFLAKSIIGLQYLNLDTFTLNEYFKYLAYNAIIYFSLMFVCYIPIRLACKSRFMIDYYDWKMFE